MSKHKRKRFLSILITAVLVFTLALSSVMAQDDEHVRTDKLSVEGESVEVIEGIVGEDDADVVADEAIASGDAEAEETDADEAADAEKISAEDVIEEADADAAEDGAEADAGIMTLSAGDVEDDEYGIQTLADVTVTSNLQNAIDAASSGDTITLGGNITESVTVASGQNITLDLNGYTLNGGGSTVITVEGTLMLKDSSSAGTGTVTGASATHGGVIVQNGGNFTLSSGTISGNTASGSGAGVFVNSYGGNNASFTMTGGEISNNTAARYGGGVDVTMDGDSYTGGGNSAFTMTGGTISGNTASDMYGGGVFVESKSGEGESTFTMSGGTISGNKASYGAGVTVSGATLNLSSNALITNNAASTTTSGGGGGNVYLYGSDAAELNMTGGTISYGSAYSGGGVNVAAGTVNMSGGTIDYNTSTAPSSASAGGGGVYVKSGATFNLSGSAVVSNSESHYSGSGFYVSGSLVMSGGTITKNTVKDTGHYAGGGVCLSGDNASFTMSGGTISENDGFSGGGGVAASGGTFTMSGGSIENNTAIYGGGVDAEYTTITMTGGSITGNTARDGSVEGNARSAAGGGVYISNNSAGFTVSGGAVTGNVREDGTVDNVYISNGKYITLGTDLSTVPATVAASGASNQIGVTTANEPTESTPVRFTDVENGTEYYATSASYFFSDQGYGVRSNEGAYLELYLMDFEEQYLTGDDGELYTAATADNYKQILSGASDWDAMDSDEQEKINDDLTAAWQAAGNTGTLTYEDLLAQAQAIADEVNAFEESYLGGADSLYTEATAENYQEILAGASDWDAMSDEAKAAVNADLTAAWQAAGNEGELTYEDLLAQAQAVADANAFEESYLGGASSLYTEATADNYQEILAGASDWANMSDEAKTQVNVDLTAAWQAAGNEGELTYDDLLAQAFELAYLTDDSGNGPYTEVTADNIDQILSGADDWALMSDEAKAAVNAALQDESGDSGLTYDGLLAQAFEQKYLMADGDGNLYTEATADNYQQILAGASDWDLLSPEAQAQINADLTAANGGEELTYPMLLAMAQALADEADQFIYSYVSDSDPDNPYLEATADNYQQILAGEDTWNAMSEEAQKVVNDKLTAAWQAAGNEGELTYPMLLEQAKAFSAAADFIYNFVSDNDVDNPYLEATVDNYQRILAGESTWNSMSKAEQDAVNAMLTEAWQAAGNEGELTYPMLLEQAEAFAASLGNVKTGDSTRLYLYVILAAAAAAAAAGAAVSRRRRV